MKKHTQMRQGDLLFQLVDELPKGVKEVKDSVLAYGETTGHKHVVVADGPAIKGEPFRIVEDSRGRKYIEFFAPGKVVHDEHKSLSFAKGSIYEVVRQREYDEREPRIVAD